MHKGSTTHRLSQPRQTIYERVRHTSPQAMQYGTHPSLKIYRNEKFESTGMAT